MKPATVKGLLFAALGLLYLLHNDLWIWDDPTLVAGLPVGLFYHVLYCLACALMMWLVCRYGWPAGLDADGVEEGAGPPPGRGPRTP